MNNFTPYYFPRPLPPSSLVMTTEGRLSDSDLATSPVFLSLRRRNQRVEMERELYAQGVRTELQMQYDAIHTAYCRAIGHHPPFLPMENLSYHYGNLLLTYRDPGRPRKQMVLTLKNFKAYVRGRGIPYHKKAAVQFLDEATSLFSDWKFTPFERFSRELIQNGKHDAAAFARSVKSNLEYFDGHFIYHMPNGQFSYPVSIQSPVFKSMIKKAGFTGPEIRTLLSILKQELRRDRINYYAQSLDQFDIVYFDQIRSYGVRYNKRGNCLDVEEHEVSYAHTQKRVNMSFRASLKNQPDDFLRSLFFFTGGNEIALSDMAKLLLSIVAPTPRGKQLSVIFTSQNKLAVKSFMSQVTGQKCLMGIRKDSGESYSSISSYLQDKHRAVLLEAQINGCGYMLCDEKLPTPSQEVVFRRFIKGGRISAKDKLIGAESFHNQIHVVYVTDDESLAKTLVQQYKAFLVDLSPYEKPWEGEINLTSAERQWINHCLIVHGCACKRGLVKPKVEKKQRLKGQSQKKQPKFTNQQIQDFLDHQCRYGKTLQCSHIELYEAYVEYCIRCKDEEPKIERIQFGKEVRKVLPSSVVKKVARHGPENKPITCYVGLGIRKKAYIPPETAPAQDEPSEDELTAFRSYLEEMEKLAEKVLPLPHDAKPQIIGRGFSRYEGQSDEDVSRELISQDTPEAGNAE